jgi:Xaa-Pro aminopeptidase
VGFETRLQAAASSIQDSGIDALLITPGADLRYLVGYDAKPLERLTCLVVPAHSDPFMVVPALEELAALASPLSGLGLEIVTWDETDDAIALVARRLAGAGTVALDDHMWAEKVLRFRSAMPKALQVPAGSILGPMRIRKDPEEIVSLVAAGAAIDSVHERVSEMLRPGRTEREVGRDIHDAIIDAGHAHVDFVIVASGPNGASPHHDVSDRVIREGDCVVIDIGGTMPDGYCSDSTRTYALGEPDPDFLQMYAVLYEAQQAAVQSVRPGMTCEAVDAVARDLMSDAGIGELFIHRIGHGIGLQSHEEPYLVSGNSLAIEEGMAFSIEPGFYLEGRFGARIEDIVICTADGVMPVNHRPHHLQIIG